MEQITGKDKMIVGIVEKQKNTCVSDEHLHRVIEAKKEILKRDFTKRQHNILFFLFELSYMLGRDSAIIPFLQDFEICGVSKTKARAEIDKLVELDVIEVSDNNKSYRMLDSSQWKVSHNSGYNENRLREIIMINGLYDGKK